MEEAHIYVYGVIDYWQDNNAGEWGYVNLKDVKNQYEAQKDAKTITVHIHSEGGVVTEGFAIHDYLRSLGKPVNVVIEGMCASIATVIALSGDTVKMAENATFFIHNPWGMIGGDAEQIKKYADELVKMEDDIADFYAKKTNLKKEELLGYMKDETYFTAAQALEFGFITEILQTMRAVALFKPESKSKPKKSNKMSKKNKSKFEKLMKNIQKGFAEIMGEESKPKDIVLQDVNGVELDFSEVEDGESPQVGDTATVDGSPAEGEYTMPEGEVYNFEAGELMTIEDSEEETEEDVEALKQELEDVEAQNKKLKKEKSELESEVKANAKSLKKLKKQFAELQELSGGIDFEASGSGNGNKGHKPKEAGDGKTRQLWKDGDYKRAN